MLRLVQYDLRTRLAVVWHWRGKRYARILF
jgi:hypothetical protein